MPTTGMIVVTDHACGFLPPKHWLCAAALNTTYNCKCGDPQVIVKMDKNIIRSMNFHVWMHATNPNWPIDGANTGYLDI